MIRGGIILAISAALIAAAQAHGSLTADPAAIPVNSDAPFETSRWSAPIVPAPVVEAAQDDDIPIDPPPPAVDYDVVDAHWMALTMWGEARGEGEDAMRAVGHVIDNRRRAGRHGDHVTSTVSAAWQFSCWNPGDPNRRALDRIDALDPDGQDAVMWAAARRIAAEIMAGSSVDPTGGALFYHTTAVAPAWSRGLAPVVRIGPHLFFNRAV